MADLYKNPFSRIRAEQMGDSTWKYFVEPSKDYIGSRPLIFESSRGTGKTMFFKCNSWKDKYAESQASDVTFEQFLSKNQHIGFYYKVDGRFVKSLDRKNIDNSIWTGIFNTYFNIVISKEIIEFISILIQSDLISFESFIPTFKKICLRLKKDTAKSLIELDSFFDETLISIELYSNNTTEPQPVGLNAGTIIQELFLALKSNALLADTTFHVFVDEYEELNRYQQIILNTLLKQSNNNIVYDFGVITKGIQCYETVSGQEIRPKDDFLIFSIDRYDYYETASYNDLLIEICKKRLREELTKSNELYNDKYLNINFYLKHYGTKYENALFSEKHKELDILKENVLNEINKQARIYKYSESDIQEYYNELINCEPTTIRIHLALLKRNNKLSSASNIVKQKINKSPEYKEWLHNTGNAAVYLLCHELGIPKKYHGFKVFSALSSGVIRSFLELAEYAFDYAINNSHQPFSFSNPRELTIEEQTKAVYFVSKLKINEIDTYEPCGFKLKGFTTALGEIFRAIQTNPDSTLGEVEQNHFETKAHELKKYNSEASELLKYAVRFKILEEDDPTKTKSDYDVEITDYHLNHIYCPTFKISHLRKRKIPITHIDLTKLFCGTPIQVREVVRKLSGITNTKMPNLFTETDELSGEI